MKTVIEIIGALLFLALLAGGQALSEATEENDAYTPRSSD